MPEAAQSNSTSLTLAVSPRVLTSAGTEAAFCGGVQRQVRVQVVRAAVLDR
jgi:hypothetical protein